MIALSSLTFDQAFGFRDIKNLRGHLWAVSGNNCLFFVEIDDSSNLKEIKRIVNPSFGTLILLDSIELLQVSADTIFMVSAKGSISIAQLKYE